MTSPLLKIDCAGEQTQKVAMNMMDGYSWLPRNDFDGVRLSQGKYTARMLRNSFFESRRGVALFLFLSLFTQCLMRVIT